MDISHTMACCSVVQQCHPTFKAWTVVVLFNSATYLFTNYNHRAVGLLRATVREYSLSTIQHKYWRGGGDGMEAIIKALTTGFDRY